MIGPAVQGSVIGGPVLVAGGGRGGGGGDSEYSALPIDSATGLGSTSCGDIAYTPADTARLDGGDSRHRRWTSGNHHRAEHSVRLCDQGGLDDLRAPRAATAGERVVGS